MTEPADPLQTQIAAARRHAGMNQQELADALGITKSTLGRWESGHTPVPSLRYQRRGLVAEILDITGAPAETFSERDVADRLTALEAEMDQLKMNLAAAIFRDLDSDEEAELRKYLTSGVRSESQGHEAANE